MHSFHQFILQFSVIIKQFLYMKIPLTLLIALWCASLCASQSCTCDTPLSIGQFNSGQETFEAFKQERFSATVDFVNSQTNFDVFCMEEFWVESEKLSMINSVKQTYPYSFTPPSKPVTCTARCNQQELDRLVDCVASLQCQLKNNILEFLACLHSNCDGVFSSLSDRCQRCLIDPFHPTIEDKLTRCGGFKTTSDGLLTSCIPLFDGTVDTLILSKHNFTDTAFHYYNIAPDAAWSIVYGRFVHPQVGPVNVFCTHLVANVPLVSFSSEQQEEAIELLNFATQQVGNRSELIFLVGDFNSGPGIGDNSPVNVDTYNVFVHSGYADSTIRYATDHGTTPSCTICKDNHLLQTIMPSHNKNEYVDHIFVNANANVCVSNSSTFATENSVPVQPVSESNVNVVPLSDHYALLATFCVSNNSIGSTARITDAVSTDSASTVAFGYIVTALTAIHFIL